MLLQSFDNNSLLHHSFPMLTNKTIDGKTIDSNYFKGHITIVSCMFIGCQPCMNEITTLNKIQDDYSGKGVQVLCIARQTRTQMMDFNGSNGSLYSKIRTAAGADSIRYPIQPACPDAPNVTPQGNYITIKSECNAIGDVYGINSFPALFFVDRNGIVQKLDIGGPGVKNDSSFYTNIKMEINQMLEER